MKLLYKESSRTIVLYSDSYSLLFRQLGNKSKEPVVSMEVLPNNQVRKLDGFKPLLNREVFGCLGFISIDRQIFLAIITGAVTDVARPVNYESVDRIYSVDFISLSKDTWDFVTLDSSGMPVSLNANGMSNDDEYDNALYSTEPHPCNELKKLLSNGSFYYSNDFDLTSLLQNRGIDSDRLRNRNNGDIKINLLHYQEEYMWNSFMMEGLIKYRSTLDPSIQKILDDNKFLTTVIRGFAKTVKLNSRGDNITIISKQSWKRAGTRFNARGIDDDGNVANFVETEFIYNNPSKGSISSFIQIRGSVPAFWEQDSTLINPKITITRSLEATQPIFNTHFDNVCSKYGVCHIVNLLSKTKASEVPLLKRYRQLYNNSNRREELSYTEFDFHHETKQSGGFSGATKILPFLYDSLEQFGWFSYDTEHGESITKQDGVFRVNCLDCLDRTNLVEQVICQHVFECIINNAANSSRDRYETSEILVKYNSLWADNGDAISQIYTGTNALKSSFSRSGKMNLAGALSDVTKSVSRMYQNTFVDNKKQYTMDLLLGYDSKNPLAVRIYDPVSDYVQEKLKQQEDSFTSYEDIFIFTGTLNVNAALPNPDFDLTTWLFPDENLTLPLPDIYAIGLQELIELNAGSILNADTSRPAKWAQLVETQLNSQNEQYLLLRTESIASMTILLFVKKSKVLNISHVSGSSKKTGLGGITANKGACAVRLNYGATTFSLITSHLAAGTAATFERHNDYSTIMSGLTFVRNMNIIDHDHIIWFGDLNYRIDLMNENVRQLVSEKQYEDLFQYDQLNNEMNSNKGAFKGFNEFRINFDPTYKFDKGTSNYDTSEKQRVPSWTDRVLSRSQNDADPLLQLNYNALMDVMISDHKPVYATFKCKVKFVDEEKKLSLAQSLYDNYKKEHPDSESSSFTSSPSPSASSNAISNSFSELNLLDDFSYNSLNQKENSLPLPRRAPTSGSQPLPRKVPPPPASRRATEVDKTKVLGTHQPIMRKLPPKPTDIELLSGATSPELQQTPAVVKPALPSRRPNMPIGFTSTPLIPSNNTTPRASALPLPAPSALTLPLAGSNGNGMAAKSLAKITPIVPKKPASLTGASSPSQPQSQPQSTATTPPQPSPKPQSLTMSDWKPLVPK